MTGKRVRAIVMGLLLVGSLVTVAYAQGVGDFCNSVNDFGVGHDSCVTCLNKGKGNDAVCLCKLFSDFGINLGFKNQGECVKTITHIIHGN